FTQRFVAEKAGALVSIIHSSGKQAYVFYDDSWVGMEPYGKYFSSIGFDGLIKCVFSGFECRLCAGADVPVHEIRFHPYLFPVGLGGLPTFAEGGHPEEDAREYWLHVRRALARQSVDRIGLGGYLHLTIGQDAFNESIRSMGEEFRRLKELHAHGGPASLNIRVTVLHTWGSLRSWTLSGHFHETDGNILIHINEALSGLPVDVRFISFEDVKNGALKDADVLINAGKGGDAWTGGNVWKNPELVTEITRFVYEGGSLIGAGEPSAVEGGDTRFALSHILGVDQDRGEYACHQPWTFNTEQNVPFDVCEEALSTCDGIRLTAPDTRVYAEKNGTPVLTLHDFGKGRAAYLGGFAYSPAGARMLLDMLLYMTGKSGKDAAVCSDPSAEAAWFHADDMLVLMNNSGKEISVTVDYPLGSIKVKLNAYEMRFLNVKEGR
ncbi:MAG: D-galactosyl-beta-1-4-L-rhamnose phosphorylase, partial [Clostridiales bacterium]|nr:D-galactosyl-beta-1-4-L-rhamnose phosphorylase [Clostridiales bacterium]